MSRPPFCNEISCEKEQKQNEVKVFPSVIARKPITWRSSTTFSFLVSDTSNLYYTPKHGGFVCVCVHNTVLYVQVQWRWRGILR